MLLGLFVLILSHSAQEGPTYSSMSQDQADLISVHSVQLGLGLEGLCVSGAEWKFMEAHGRHVHVAWAGSAN